MIKNFLAVGAGGAIGAMLRYGVTVLGVHLNWTSSLSTFLVNAIGSFIMGVLVSSCEQGTLLLMATVGICGGFTTFSTFSMQTVNLMREGRWCNAAAYILGTLVVCILMAAAGGLAGQRIR